MAEGIRPPKSTLGIFQGDPFATEEQRDRRLQGLLAGYFTSVMDTPQMLREFFAPDAGLTPGELTSSPKDKLMGERFAWEEYMAEQKQDPDFAKGAQLGFGASMVADPFFDVPGVVASRALPLVKQAMKEGKGLDESIQFARKTLASQRGAIDLTGKGLGATEDQFRLRGLEALPEVGSVNPTRGAKKFDPFLGQAGDLNAERSVREGAFGSNLSTEAQDYIKWTEAQARKNNSVVHGNSKTGLSIDFCTSCPKRMAGKGRCAYCYVDNARSGHKIREASGGKDLAAFWMKGKGLNETAVTDEILRMPPDLVTELNKDGGLRMFSFGDFRPGIDDANVSELLSQAEEKGLYIKAITKEPELLKRFADHPNLRVNFSTDMLPPEISRAVPLDEAYQLTKDMPNVKIRVVAVNQEQAKQFAADPRVDVITLYHGPVGEDLLKIVKHDNPELVKEVGEERLLQEFNSWKDMSPDRKSDKEIRELVKGNEGKFCCQGGKCSKDPTKCGFGVNGLIPGVVFAPLADREK